MTKKKLKVWVVESHPADNKVSQYRPRYFRSKKSALTMILAWDAKFVHSTNPADYYASSDTTFRLSWLTLE